MAARKPPDGKPDVLDDGATRGPNGRFNPGVNPGTGVMFGPGNNAGRGRPKFDFRRMIHKIATEPEATAFAQRVWDLAMGRDVVGVVEEGMRRDAMKAIWNDVITRAVQPDAEAERAVADTMARSGPERLLARLAQAHLAAESTGEISDVKAAVELEKSAAEVMRIDRASPDVVGAQDGWDTMVPLADGTVTKLVPGMDPVLVDAPPTRFKPHPPPEQK